MTNNLTNYIAQASVRIADALIKELKKDKKDEN